jgi:hypothetical protein
MPAVRERIKLLDTEIGLSLGYTQIELSGFEGAHLQSLP